MPAKRPALAKDHPPPWPAAALERLNPWQKSTFVLALEGAIALWAALPPLGWSLLAWIAPAWWVLLTRQEKLAGKRPYLALWSVGFLFWLAELQFLRLPDPATSLGWVALSLYLAFYLPLFVGLVRMAVHGLRWPVIVAAPVVWTGLELARGHLITGFTMASVGHTQYAWISLIQMSDLAGAYGVSFVVMFVAACLARMLPCDGERYRVWPLVPAAAVLGAVLIYGHARMVRDEGPPDGRIALIQGSIDTTMKSDVAMNARIFDQYLNLSRDAVARFGQVDLVVWPETMFRDTLFTFSPDATPPKGWRRTLEDLEGAASYSRRMMALTAEALDAPLILGVERCHCGANVVDAFNSAVYVSRQGEISGRYDKMHLVLFGEYVPLGRRFPWLQRLTPLKISLSEGVEPAAFDVGRLRIAPNICFETVLPHVIRRQVTDLAAKGREPNVLVNLTNDGWFWGSSELDLHLICGVFRAVECRKPLLIAANTGFSAWIDADGRIRAQGPRRATGALLAEVRIDRRSSWYLRDGDWPAGLCLAATLFVAAAGGWRRWRWRRCSPRG